MAAPKGAGDLRQRLTFQRRLLTDDGFGNERGDWLDVIDRAASLTPTRGGEDIQAGRRTGTAMWDVWLRNDSEARALETGDRIIDSRQKSRTWNIVFGPVDMHGDGAWLFLQATSGGADG